MPEWRAPLDANRARLDALAEQNAALLATLAAAHAAAQPPRVVIVPPPVAPAPSTVPQQVLDEHHRTLRSLLGEVAQGRADLQAAGAERDRLRATLAGAREMRVRANVGSGGGGAGGGSGAADAPLTSAELGA